MDLIFFSICAIILELHVANNINLDAETNDDEFFVTCILDQVRSNKEDLPDWHQHPANERLIINDLQQSGISVDKVTQFFLRSPQLRSTIDTIGNYYRWFYIIMNKS